MAELGNIQAIVANRSAKALTVLLLFKIEHPRSARAFLREWISRAPAATQPEIAGQPVLHFFFSWAGMAALLADHGTLDASNGEREFEAFFVDRVQGPASRGLRDQLGFVGASSPANWWEGRFKSDDIDMAVYIAADDAEAKADLLARVRHSAARSGLRELQIPSMADHALAGHRPPNGRVHFGYRDGISTPAVDWNDSRTQGGPNVNFREFLVGYPSDDYPTSPHRPGPWQDFARDGSFVGVTWIYQDVASFNAFIENNAAAAAGHCGPADPGEWMAAKLMGRWRDGSPLSKYPLGPPAAADPDNAFGFADDLDGSRCPLSSHIRVTNLRDQSMTFANRVRFPCGPPRLIRRGFSYGPPFEGTQDDGVDRGLVGLFFCARINEQFYTVLRWMQTTEFSDAFDAIPSGRLSQDAIGGNRSIAGANTRLHMVAGSPSSLVVQLADFIRYKGVAVLFVPSISALAALGAT